MEQNSVSNSGGRSIVERVKAILLKPVEEWPVIEGEASTTTSILTGYAVPLAAIGPVASFIGGQIFGYGAFGFHYRPGIGSAIGSLVLGYVLSLVGLFVLAAIANFLAPKFGGQADTLRAFKLVAYSATAAWVAGIFGLIPAITFLSIAGLYSIYLFYTGASPMMKVPADKATSYTAVTFVAAIILYLVLGAMMASLAGMFGGLPDGAMG